LYDHDYVEQYTLGFDELKSRAAEFPASGVAAITGILADDIQPCLANTRNASPLQSARSGRRAKPGRRRAIRAITILPALVGAWRLFGAALWKCRSGNFHSTSRTCAGRTGSNPERESVNELDLGQALTGE